MSEGRLGSEWGGSLRLPSRPEPAQCEGARRSGVQPVMRDSGLELAWRILWSLGPGGGDLGETCAALCVLGLRDGVGSVPSPDPSAGLAGNP